MIKTTRNRALLALTLAFAGSAFFAGGVRGGEWGKVVLNDKAPIESAWSFCDVFDYGTIYKGDGFIRKVALKGRYQGQYVDTSDLVDGDRFWEHRRFRTGVVIDMAHNLTFNNVWNMDTSRSFDGDRFFDNIDTMFLQWKPSSDFYIIVGKDKPKITREYTTSSSRILSFERSTLVNNVTSEKSWGTAVGFNALGLNHEVGVWANTFDDQVRFTHFSGGGMLTYRANYDITEATTLFFDYQYNNNSAMLGRSAFADAAGSPWQHLFAIGSESKWGNLGLVTDLIVASDGPNAQQRFGNDTWGVVIMPYYDITDKLQLVLKYAYMDEGRIDRPQRNSGFRPWVDNYHTFYAGLTYRICGDKLKLMGGYEYATGDVQFTGADYKADSWLVGVRMDF